jgi:hypothetical protein
VALSEEERDILGRLQMKVLRAQRRNRLLNAYYEGEQRVEQLGLAIPPELRRFLTIVAWPGTYVDALAERTVLEGFELPDATDADDDLWRIWQENNLDRESKLGHVDALALDDGAFVSIGAGDEDRPDSPSADSGDDDRPRDAATPLITVESSDEMAVELSPRSRQPLASGKFYIEDSVQYATLKLPNVTKWLERRNAQWIELDVDDHDMGVVSVVPLTHRMRVSNRSGRSIMRRIIGLTDAAARALTNAQVATEALAVPQRYVAGAQPSDFKDKDGNVLPVWEVYFGSVWALANKEAKVGSLSAADLANFSGIVNHYAALVSGVTGLPMRYLGQATTNPPSAEGILADESRLIKQVEDFQTGMEAGWERVMQIAKRIQTGDWDPRLRQLETKWRSAATPTRAQAADATVKLVQAGILPVEAGWEDLGYSAARRKKLRDMRDAELARDPVREIVNGLNQEPPAAAGNQQPVADAVPA